MKQLMEVMKMRDLHLRGSTIFFFLIKNFVAFKSYVVSTKSEITVKLNFAYNGTKNIFCLCD